MSKKLNLLLLIIAVSVISIGCTKEAKDIVPSNNQEKEEVNTQIEENTQIIEPEIKVATTTTTTTLPSVLNLKPGDKVGSFTVTKVGVLNEEKPFSANNFSVSFSGQATVTGKYEMSYLFGEYFIIPDDTSNLPALSEREIYELSFPGNSDKFSSKEKISEGRATVTFDGLIIQSASEEYSMTGSEKIVNIEILK